MKNTILLLIAIPFLNNAKAQSSADSLLKRTDSLLIYFENNTKIVKFNSWAKKRKNTYKGIDTSGKFHFRYKTKIKHNGQFIEKIIVRPSNKDKDSISYHALVRRRNNELIYIRVRYYERTLDYRWSKNTTEYYLKGGQYLRSDSKNKNVRLSGKLKILNTSMD